MSHLQVLLTGALGLLPTATAITNIWLAGDSTMASGGGGTGTEGWGQYLKYSFDSSEYVVNNEAVAGRSARSYWREGRFQDIADEVSAGDVSTVAYEKISLQPFFLLIGRASVGGYRVWTQ